MSSAAAIDLGTNTARLLIGSLGKDGTIEQLQVRREIVRLGGGFSKKTGLALDAEERALIALRSFAATIKTFGVTNVRAVATSAVRDAVNGPAFCAMVHRETGLCLEVIDGREEGLLTLRGVRSGIDASAKNLLVFDVGGGSTEYTIAIDNCLKYTESLPLGVVRLTEGKGSQEAIEDKIDRELAGLQQRIRKVGADQYLCEIQLVGTAGTATTLAAISLGMADYDYRKVNNCLLTREEIQAIFARLLPLTPEQRLQITGLERGREDLIIAGILLTLRTMDRFGCDTLKVSDFGLLEGVFLTLTDQGPANVFI